MKILQIGKFWPVRGGVEKVMYDLTAGLSRRGIRCDMLCAASEGPAEEIVLNPCGTVTAVSTLLKASSTMIAPAMIARLRRTAASYDIIHVHHPDPMAALALRLSGYRGKVVLHWHSDILRQRMLLKLYRPLQSWLLGRADTVICTSPSYAAGSEALAGVGARLRCVPIGIDPVVPVTDPAARPAWLPRGRRVVFSMGRMIPYKGFDNLILAAAELPADYVTVIAGSGPLYEPLRAMVRNLHLESCVIMPGRITDAERDALLGAAGVFVLPSVEKTEAYGIVIIEAMSAGVPVIATEIPGSGTSWVNAHGVSGLNVPVADPQALARAVTDICSDESVRAAYAAGARRRWEENFTGDRFLDTVAGIYDSLLRQASPAPRK